MLDTYVPEADDGRTLGPNPYMSARMWLPLQQIPNPRALINAAVFTYEDPNSGDVREVRLAEQIGDYLVIARHLFENWDELVDGYAKPKFVYEYVPFEDHITPRNADQVRAWAALEAADHGILNLGCGKGKTVMALKKIASKSGPGVVICPAGIIDQWIERAEEHLKLPRDQIGIVRQKKREWDKPLVICSIDTLVGLVDDIPMEIRTRFQTVFFDEVHHLAAKTFLKTAPLFFGDRFGLTATPERKDGLEPVYYAHLGEIFYSDTKGDLTAQVIINQVDTEIDLRRREVRDVRGELSVGKLRTYLGTIPSRNRIILRNVAKALQRGRKILVLTHSADHVPILHEKAVANPIISQYDVGLVLQRHKVPKRLATIRGSDVSFATMGVAAEALDAARLDTLFICTPFASWTEFVQARGRIERALEGKKDPIMVIFDDHKVNPAHYMLRKLLRRMKVEGVKYTTLHEGT